MPILLIWYHNAGLVTIRAGQGQGFSPATMSVSSSNSYRKQKENRTKRTSELYNSPATDHIYKATWSVSDSLAQWPLSSSHPDQHRSVRTRNDSAGNQHCFLERRGWHICHQQYFEEPYYSGTTLVRSPSGQKKLAVPRRGDHINDGFFTRKCMDVFARQTKKGAVITRWLY